LVTLPTAFSTNTYIPSAVHSGSGPAIVVEDSTVAKTMTQMPLRLFYPDLSTLAGWPVRWRAVGW
jgi:hypothetical protein